MKNLMLMFAGDKGEVGAAMKNLLGTTPAAQNHLPCPSITLTISPLLTQPKISPDLSAPTIPHYPPKVLPAVIHTRGVVPSESLAR